MKTSISVAVGVALALTVTSQTASARADTDRDAAAPVVRSWNAVAMTTLVAAATPVAEQPLHLAAVHRAVYDAVIATSEQARGDVDVAAVSAAAHTVLVAEFPAQASRLDQELTTALAAVPDDGFRARGLAAGRAAAAAVLQERSGDGRDGPTLAVPPSGPGVWTPTPPNTVGGSSWLGDVRPFVVDRDLPWGAFNPPPLDSDRWARDYNETRLLGSASSTARTAAQTEVARFWADPALVQNQRALRAYSERTQMDTVRTAELFALADTASADALIACFATKYRVEFWRPFTAIPRADQDNNPDTSPDTTWRPLLVTPNFPEYPSAHSCSSTAIATVVVALAPSHDFDFTIDSRTTGTSHRFTSVRQLNDEIANARVWGGLHWRFSTEVGTRIGRSVGRAVLASHEAQDER